MAVLSLKLPDETAVKLALASKRRGVPKSKLIREGIEAVLKKEPHVSVPTLYDLMKNHLGCIKGGGKDRSTNPKYLKGYGRSCT